MISTELNKETLSLLDGEDESKDLCHSIRADWYNYKWEDAPVDENVMGDNIMQKPLQINTSVHIYDLVNVDISNAQFTVVFGITIKWFDKRLTYGFLKKNALMNHIEYYLREAFIKKKILGGRDSKIFEMSSFVFSKVVFKIYFRLFLVI